MGTMNRSRLRLAIMFITIVVLSTSVVAQAQSTGPQGVVNDLLGKYKSAGKAWEATIEQAATNLFWWLATISLGWTCVSMAIKQSDLVEIVAELCRFIMFTGLFLWLLMSGSTFSSAIIHSVWEIGGDAGGAGQQIFPMAVLNLGLQVYQQTLQHVNWLQPESIVAPI